MKRRIVNGDNIAAMAEVERVRSEGFAKASAEWERLTAGDWPESEHQQRTDALLKKALLMPPVWTKRRSR